MKPTPYVIFLVTILVLMFSAIETLSASGRRERQTTSPSQPTVSTTTVSSQTTDTTISPMPRKPGKTKPKNWPEPPPDVVGKKPKWDPKGRWTGKGGIGIVWDPDGHGGGHWDEDGVDARNKRRWREDGTTLTA